MTIRRESKATLTLGAVEAVTPPFDVTGLRFGTIQATWSGLATLDSTLKVQVSSDGVNWNDANADDNEAVLSEAAETQLWEVLEVTSDFYRLVYTPNSNTTGTATVDFKFRDRSEGA